MLCYGIHVIKIIKNTKQNDRYLKYVIHILDPDTGKCINRYQQYFRIYGNSYGIRQIWIGSTGIKDIMRLDTEHLVCNPNHINSSFDYKGKNFKIFCDLLIKDNIISIEDYLQIILLCSMVNTK